MKRVLFASTALVAFAGAASAEVLLSGNAEMGLQYGNGGVANTDDTVEFFTDIDVTFTLSGETDGGLTFGANVDLDESDGSNVNAGPAVVNPGPDEIFGTPDDFVQSPGANGASAAFDDRSQGGESIFLSGGFGTLTMGDTDGAVDWALTEVAFGGGSLNDDETEHAGFNGNAALDGSFDGQILRYDYSVGDFGFALSAEIDDGDTDADEASTILGIGIKYQIDLGGQTIGLGLGYQTGENLNDNDDIEGDNFDDVDALGASVNGTFGPVQAGISYLTVDTGVDASSYDHFGVGVGFDVGPVLVGLNYGEYDFDGAGDQDGYGVTAGYDLGGGALIQLGYGKSNFDDAEDYDTMSFGVRMNF